MSDFIPVNEPLFSGNEKKYLCECIDSGWISSEGPFVKKFEHDYSGYIGIKHGIAVSSGTAALETALYALGVGEGDEVIMPAFTIISCALACMRLGAVPVLVDIDPDIWTMDVMAVESRITGKTKAVMPVHIYGHPVDMDPLLVLKNKYGFTILEDAAEVHGAEYHSKYHGNKWLKCGALGDVAATSFYANKIISTGEGGMVLAGEDRFAERARDYRNLCFTPTRRFCHQEAGYNFRMTNLQAAIGVAQLEQIEKFIKLKTQVAGTYKEYLANTPGIRFMQTKPWAKSVYWMCAVILDQNAGITADMMIKKLGQHNIETRPFFYGLHNQPVLTRKGLFAHEHYPHTDKAAEYGFYLPSSANLVRDEIKRITDIIKQEIESHGSV